MFSQNQIIRLLETREYRQLIERILSNGRCRSELVRKMLTCPGVAEATATGLSLQRVCEMTYRPTATANRLAQRLIRMQSPGGYFAGSVGATGHAMLAATAIALRGLIAFANQCRSVGMLDQPELENSIERGISSLAQIAAQPDLEADAASWAIVLWQLGDVVEFRRLVSVDQLLATLDECATELLEDDLRRYAHAMAA